MLNSDYTPAYTAINELKADKGLALQDIVREVHLFVVRLGLSAETTMRLLVQLADMEARLLQAASERIQLSALVGAFQLVRDAETVDE